MTNTRFIKNVEVFAPKVRIRFHTEDGLFETATKDEPGGQEQSLVACQTYKDIGQPTGSFTIHLADYGRYDKLLKPMDFVTINMSNHTPHSPTTGNLSYQRDQLTHATMIGFIDEVRRKVLIDPNSGKPQVFCEIKGRDFGKLLVKHQIAYIPWLAGENQGMTQPVIAMFKSLLSGLLSGGEIDFLVANNMRKMLTQSVKLSFPFNGKTLDIMNCLSYRSQKNIGVIPYNLPVMGQEGSLWQILSNFANLPFNEMWVDTINNPRRVIADKVGPENAQVKNTSDFSSPLDSSELTADRQAVSAYIKKQTSSSDSKQSVELFGTNGEKISVAQKYTDDPDSSNAYTMLFLRRTPFDDRDWAALPRVSISNADIQEQDIGVSDHEVSNMFWVFPLLAIPGEQEMKGLGARPMLFSRNVQFDEKPGSNQGFPKAINNPDPRIARQNAVEKFGLNQMKLQTRVWCWSRSDQQSSVVRTANLLTLAIANWNKHNSILKSGSMSMKGLPDLHVGNVLVNVDEDEEYYVEAVANNYVQYQPMTTVVQVTRGQPTLTSPDKITWGNAYSDWCGAPPAVGAQSQNIEEIVKKQETH